MRHRRDPRRLRRSILVGASLGVLVTPAWTAPAGSTGLRPAQHRTDWPTYGFDVERSEFSPLETTLAPGNVRGLRVLWRRSLGAVTITSPTVASGVLVDGIPTALVFAGTEHGDLLAVDAASGRIVWRRDLGSVRTSCYDTPDDVFGISGTPVIDRSSSRIYVAASDGPNHRVAVFALDLATGRTEPGWPVAVSTDPIHMHVWGALTLSGRSLYVTLASLCDLVPSYGRVAAIRTADATVAVVWYVVRDHGSIVGGGGIWGYGGASVDPATGRVFVATGNAFSPEPESQPNAERVVSLTADLLPLGSSHPKLRGEDVDFGATPLVFTPPGCPTLLAAENKTGAIFVYRADDVGTGAVQRIQVAGNASAKGLGLFVGLPAYSPVTNLVYVSNPGPSRHGFTNGLVAFRVDPGCRLDLAWQRRFDGDGTTPLPSPTVANGVVYVGDGRGGRVFAFDGASGRPLWDSATALRGAVYAPPVVVDGRLYLAAWIGRRDGELLSFGLPSQ